MALYIDRPAWEWRGRLWSHLISDTSIDELHGFARSIHLRYLSFGIDHYDVPDSMLDLAIDAGAELADSRELVRHLRHAGLRVRRGKDARTWRRTDLDNPTLHGHERDAIESAAARHGIGDDQLWVVERPATIVGCFEIIDFEVIDSGLGDPTRERGATIALPTPVGSRPLHRVESAMPGGVSIELVIGQF